MVTLMSCYEKRIGQDSDVFALAQRVNFLSLSDGTVNLSSLCLCLFDVVPKYQYPTDVEIQRKLAKIS